MVENNCFESIAELWKKDKKQYVKISTYSAYCLLVDNHLIPEFKGKEDITEEMVQSYVKRCPHIVSSRYGGENEGGFGVTVITLK